MPWRHEGGEQQQPGPAEHSPDCSRVVPWPAGGTAKGRVRMAMMEGRRSVHSICQFWDSWDCRPGWDAGTGPGVLSTGERQKKEGTSPHVRHDARCTRRHPGLRPATIGLRPSAPGMRWLAARLRLPAAFLAVLAALSAVAQQAIPSGCSLEQAARLEALLQSRLDAIGSVPPSACAWRQVARLLTGPPFLNAAARPALRSSGPIMTCGAGTSTPHL